MSNVLIAYASKHGCAEECAKALASKMNARAELWNLKDKKSIDLNDFDKVILGGPIYAGRILKEVKEFYSKNENILKDKKLGLFICGMSEGDAAKKQVDQAFPQVLLNAALVKDSFGGKIEFNKMNFMERKIIKVIAKTESDILNVSESHMDQFAQVMNQA